jgi:hypothetical protein
MTYYTRNNRRRTHSQTPPHITRPKRLSDSAYRVEFSLQLEQVRHPAITPAEAKLRELCAHNRHDFNFQPGTTNLCRQQQLPTLWRKMCSNY